MWGILYRKEDAEEDSEKSDEVNPLRGEVHVTSNSGLADNALPCLGICAATESPVEGEVLSLKSWTFILVLVSESSFPSTSRDRPLS